MSLLSYPVDQAAPVMEANLTSDFRSLFVNALASADPRPYLMLAEVTEQQGTGPPDWKRPTGWNYGGTSPGGDSWHILFDLVRSRPTDELTSGKLDSSLNALERMRWFSSGVAHRAVCAVPESRLGVARETIP